MCEKEPRVGPTRQLHGPYLRLGCIEDFFLLLNTLISNSILIGLPEIDLNIFIFAAFILAYYLCTFKIEQELGKQTRLKLILYCICMAHLSSRCTLGKYEFGMSHQ